MSISISLSNYPDLSDKAYEVIKSEILAVRLAPGTPLRVVELAQRLGVSRTPVKDALNRLATEGLVQDVPRKGYFVASLTTTDVDELLDARRILELAAVERGVEALEPATIEEMRRLLAETEALIDPEAGKVDYAEFIRRDYDFHLLIVGNIRNRRLVEIYRGLNLHLNAPRVLHFSAEAGYQRALETVREHRAIVDALESRDLAVVKEAITVHIQSVTPSFASLGLG